MLKQALSQRFFLSSKRALTFCHLLFQRWLLPPALRAGQSQVVAPPVRLRHLGETVLEVLTAQDHKEISGRKEALQVAFPGLDAIVQGCLQ